MKKRTYILEIIVVLIVVLLFFINPFERKVPEGLPNHYYDLVDNVSSKDTQILIYSDIIDLNEHVSYIDIENLGEVYADDKYINMFLVIDMQKYIENYSDGETINQIYKNSCVTIIIANYRESSTTLEIDFFDFEDYDSDLLLTMNNDLCNTNYSKNVIGNSFPGLTYLNFAIIHHISLDIDESNNQ